MIISILIRLHPTGRGVLHTHGVVNNVIEMMQLGIEEKLKGKLVPVTE